MALSHCARVSAQRSHLSTNNQHCKLNDLFSFVGKKKKEPKLNKFKQDSKLCTARTFFLPEKNTTTKTWSEIYICTLLKYKNIKSFSAYLRAQELWESWQELSWVPRSTHSHCGCKATLNAAHQAYLCGSQLVLISLSLLVKYHHNSGHSVAKVTVHSNSCSAVVVDVPNYNTVVAAMLHITCTRYYNTVDAIVFHRWNRLTLLFFVVVFFSPWKYKWLMGGNRLIFW